MKNKIEVIPKSSKSHLKVIPKSKIIPESSQSCEYIPVHYNSMGFVSPGGLVKHHN